jgi:bifunctional non-homologous end joining protein LigD
VVVGWTDPEGTRPWLGALLLAYYDPGGRLVYAGRAGTGSSRRSWNGCGAAYSRSPRPMPLEVPPPRASRFRWPLALSRVHWERPAGRRSQISPWTDDNLLRQVVYEGLREGKPATEVRRPVLLRNR